MISVNKERIIYLLEKIKKDKKSFLIVLIGLTGILLIFFSEFSDDDNYMPQINDKSEYDYNVSYKEELESIISKIEGVGRVEVMLTYEGSAESVYAKDFSEQVRNEEHKTDENHIILDKGSTEEGLCIMEKYPQVTGVAVVCEGGRSPTVKNEIMQMLKALFGISSSSISISEMNS